MTAADTIAVPSEGHPVRQAMREAGAVVLRGLLPPGEVQAAGAEVRRELLDSGIAQASAGGLTPAGGTPMRIGDGTFIDVVRRMMGLESVHRLSAHAALEAVARQLIGERVFVHPRKMVRVVYPTDLAELDRIPAHQDFYYVQGEPDTFTFWIPLEPVPAEKGGLEYLPGSHHGGLLPVAANQEGRFGCSASEDSYSDSAWVRTSFDVGDVLVFHSLTLHRSGVNATGGFRLSLDCRWSAADGVCNQDELLPSYYPAVPGWEELTGDWSAVDPIERPGSLTLHPRSDRPHELLDRASRYAR